MCGPSGTLTLADKIVEAQKNTSISAIVLSIDTPGGEVSGTDLLAEAIKNSEKPVVVYGSGMVCSAGVWIASGADYIFSSSKLDKWGSVGTMVMVADFTKYYENQGVKMHEIYATLSKDKNSDYKNLLEGKYDGYRAEKLDVINELFHAFVKENRNLPDSAITGKTFLGDEAKKLGFFDEYGTLQDAILKAQELSKSKNKNNTNLKTKKIYVR
jgi:protease-4